MSGKSTLRQRIAASVRGKPVQREPKEYTYGDIVLLGMAKVGKTSIADRFVNNYFTEQYKPTDGQKTYEVKALLQTEKESTKKNMVLKKSFKKSIMGTSRPPLKAKHGTKIKSVVSVRRSGDGDGGDASRAYQEGKAKGLKSLQFNLVDTPADMMEMEEISYKATISNAKGFLLVCSFDIEESLSYLEDRYHEIKNVRHGLETPIIIIANKYDMAEGEKLLEEIDVSTLAAQLHIKWCVASMETEEGCNEMSEMMLSEINMAAEQEEYLDSLAEDDFMYAEEQVDKDDLYG